MKRDFELIRKILLEVEGKAAYKKPIMKFHVDGYTHDEINYQLYLLKQSGLIDALDLTDSGGQNFYVNSLTWEGHEFLDAARDNGIWEKAKSQLKEKISGISFDILKHILIDISKQQFSI